MNGMNILASANRPKVEFDPDGKMVIEGRSLMDDPISFYKPVINWITDCTSKTFTFEMRLEYMNTSSSKLVLEILDTIKKKYNSSSVFIKWYYDSDDEDMLDTGKDFESIIHIPIDFYELQVEE